MISSVKGYVHSFQSLGTLDGPGVRFVVFMQGCNLRCGCCHNPDTWKLNDGKTYRPDEVADRVVHYREYFKNDGGITVSGGEPLLQPDFVRELFRICHEKDINTCLDTSGSILNDKIKELLKETDRVLLDMKYTTDELYNKHVGCSINKPLDFLEYLNSEKIPVTLRQVIIPSLNDNEESIKRLKEIADCFSYVDKIELLPFRKICQVKYDKMDIPFPFSHIPEPTAEAMKHLNGIISKSIEKTSAALL